MAEYLSPGVYVEEFSSGIKPMEGVSTSTAGFVGMTERGPLRGVPEFVGSFGEFQRIFGGYLPESYGQRRYLPMAVEQFFANGGSRCFVVRLLNETGTACASVTVGPVTFTAANPGIWGNRVAVRCRKSPAADGLYNFTVTAGTEPGDYAESYQDVSLNPKDKAFIVGAMEKSLLIRVQFEGNAEPQDFYEQCLEAEKAQANEARTEKLRKARALHRLKDPAYARQAQVYGEEQKAIEAASDKAVIATLKAESNATEEDKAALEALEKKVADEAVIETLEGKATRTAEEDTQLADLKKSVLDAEKAEAQTLSKAGAPAPEQKARLAYLTSKTALAELQAKKQELETLEAKETKSGEDKKQISTLKEEIRAEEERQAQEALLQEAARYAALTEPQDEDNMAAGPMLSGGLDGPAVGEAPADPAALVNAATIKGSDGGPGQRTGLCALQDIPEISIVIAPGVTDPAEVQEVLTHCETMANRVCILDMPQGMNKVTEMQAYRQNFSSSYAALYHPWIQVFDPVAGKSVYMPPSGAMAGIYARSDNTRGVHKAPANEVIRNCTGLETLFGKPEQDMLNPVGINLLRNIQGLGIRVWGARTLSSDSSWKYINVRRLFIYIEETIRRNTAWAVFEPNDQLLWTKVRGSIVSFLGTLWRDGALFGATESEAYFVNIGKGSTMTDDDILNGRLICVIGVAPVRPAEFVIFRITQIMEQNG